MTAIKAADVDRFIAKPDSNQPIVLVFGPDAGLVRERVDALVRASVDDPSDPFTFVRIDGDELAGNPSRLVEEAHTIPLFGGRRAVLVKAGIKKYRARGRNCRRGAVGRMPHNNRGRQSRKKRAIACAL